MKEKPGDENKGAFKDSYGNMNSCVNVETFERGWDITL